MQCAAQPERHGAAQLQTCALQRGDAFMDVQTTPEASLFAGAGAVKGTVPNCATAFLGEDRLCNFRFAV